MCILLFDDDRRRKLEKWFHAPWGLNVVWLGLVGTGTDESLRQEIYGTEVV